MKRTLGYGILAVAVLLPFIGVSPISASTAEGVKGEPPITGGEPLDAASVAQLPLINAADEIMALVDEEGFAGFTGTRIDDATAAVVLLWKGQVPPSMNDLVQEIRSEGVRVDVRSTDYTLSELDAEARRIAALSPSRIGVKITGVGPLDDYSGLQVSVEPGALAEAATAIKSAFPLRFAEMPEPSFTALFHRWNDFTPFWGGAMMDSGNILIGYAYCSSGFGVRRSNGTEALTTANHCGARSWGTPDGNVHVGNSSAGVASTDSTVVTGEDYARCVYTSTDFRGSDADCIIGHGNPADESLVWASGAGSGRSTVRVKLVNQYIVNGGTTIGPGFWTEHGSRVASVGQGDSGGPVVNQITEGSIRARGMLDAIDNSTIGTCTGWQTDGRLCAWRAFHVNITSVLSSQSLTLMTS